MVGVFREVWRILRDDGVAWLNVGDSYNSAASNQNGRGLDDRTRGGNREMGRNNRTYDGLKPKDRLGIPHRLVFALQADGWYWRDEVVWHKRNPMPESVTDRTTKAHEMVFLLSKRERYFYDAIAIREADAGQDHARNVLLGSPSLEPTNGLYPPHGALRTAEGRNGMGRNKRSVWSISSSPTPFAHFATMPEDLAEPCVLAGSSERGCCPRCGAPWVRQTEDCGRVAAGHSRGANAALIVERRDNGPQLFRTVKTHLGWQPSCPCSPHEPRPCTVFDPFAGAGTTLLVAARLGRVGVGIDLSETYLGMANGRIREGLRPVSKLDPKPVAPLAGQGTLFGD